MKLPDCATMVIRTKMLSVNFAEKTIKMLIFWYRSQKTLLSSEDLAKKTVSAIKCHFFQI